MAKKQDTTHPSSGGKLIELEAKIADLDNQLKRAVADYQNLEKRVSEGRSELTAWGVNALLTKMLPVLDHLEQALGGMSEEEKQSGWARGVELAVKELQSVLLSEGLEQIAADGQFDPNLHEAVDVQEMPPTPEGFGEPKENMILKMTRKGYNLNGKVLRPAQVVVGRKGDSEIISE
ncbi:MAG: nucleotide exchange factor GrpE [Candidatus Daviesbacteria bacterium]|nr:nucleotide exchange factor GrpE [Candidatus Daviesbacteria bacterium]